MLLRNFYLNNAQDQTYFFGSLEKHDTWKNKIPLQFKETKIYTNKHLSHIRINQFPV